MLKIIFFSIIYFINYIYIYLNKYYIYINNFSSIYAFFDKLNSFIKNKKILTMPLYVSALSKKYELETKIKFRFFRYIYLFNRISDIFKNINLIYLHNIIIINQYRKYVYMKTNIICALLDYKLNVYLINFNINYNNIYILNSVISWKKLYYYQYLYIVYLEMLKIKYFY